MPGTFATLDTVRKVGIGEKNLIFPNRIFTDAGWHLTYFMPVSEIQRKLASFAHSEYNTPKFANKTFLENCIRDRVDFTGRTEFIAVEPPPGIAAATTGALDDYLLGRLNLSTIA